MGLVLRPRQGADPAVARLSALSGCDSFPDTSTAPLAPGMTWNWTTEVPPCGSPVPQMWERTGGECGPGGGGVPGLPASCPLSRSTVAGSEAGREAGWSPHSGALPPWPRESGPRRPSAWQASGRGHRLDAAGGSGGWWLRSCLFQQSPARGSGRWVRWGGGRSGGHELGEAGEPLSRPGPARPLSEPDRACTSPVCPGWTRCAHQLRFRPGPSSEADGAAAWKKPRPTWALWRVRLQGRGRAALPSRTLPAPARRILPPCPGGDAGLSRRQLVLPTLPGRLARDVQPEGHVPRTAVQAPAPALDTPELPVLGHRSPVSSLQLCLGRLCEWLAPPDPDVPGVRRGR